MRLIDGYLAMSETLLTLKQVVKVYENQSGPFTALKGIDLTVSQGEFFGIMGKSGAGKSTLLNMITGVDRPTSGEIWMHTDAGMVGVHTLSENELARWRGQNIGIVYQSFELLPMLTLVENVMLPIDLCGDYRPRLSRERALELLDMVELLPHARKVPAFISGGQKQRVAIARALANDPPVIVADEPTGSLDSVTADHIFSLFERLVEKGKTIIMVTHDHGLMPRFTRHKFLLDGQWVEDEAISL